MYSGRGGMPFLSQPHHLEKVKNISCTMHYLLLLYLTIDENNYLLEEKMSLREDVV